MVKESRNESKITVCSDAIESESGMKKFISCNIYKIIFLYLISGVVIIVINNGIVTVIGGVLNVFSMTIYYYYLTGKIKKTNSRSFLVEALLLILTLIFSLVFMQISF